MSTRLEAHLGAALSTTDGLVATPPDVASLAETLRIASEAGLRVLVAGRGLRLDWGNPVEPDLTIRTAALGTALDYAPEDMVVTAEAGMTLEDLNALLATRSQVLPLEVAHPERTTLGGLVAAAPQSLSRPEYGEVKDWLIGIGVAAPDGSLVRGGGKVVKNVAGYDLCKLYAGSLGTLGAIATVTFRVRPAWEATALVSAEVPAADAEALLEAVQTTHLAPAVSLVQATCDQVRFTLGFDGFGETVEWQTQQATAMVERLGGQVRDVLRDQAARATRRQLAAALHAPAGPGVGLRASVLPSEMLAFVDRARALATAEVTALGLAPHGALWLRADVPSPTAWLAGLRAIAAESGGHVFLEGRQGWPAEANAFELDGTTRRLMHRIQAGLDPRGLMAPGRYRLEGGDHGTP